MYRSNPQRAEADVDADCERRSRRASRRTSQGGIELPETDMTTIRQACSDMLVVTGTIAAVWHLAHGKPVSALCAALEMRCSGRGGREEFMTEQIPDWPKRQYSRTDSEGFPLGPWRDLMSEAILDAEITGTRKNCISIRLAPSGEAKPKP